MVDETGDKVIKAEKIKQKIGRILESVKRVERDRGGDARMTGKVRKK